jgi:hypothetical protein
MEEKQHRFLDFFTLTTNEKQSFNVTFSYKNTASQSRLQAKKKLPRGSFSENKKASLRRLFY